MNPELSVIIVNYNGLKYIKNCFDSLYDRIKGISFEIVVLDNNSPDDSCTYIEQHYPEVVLIKSRINHGFGKGNNEAVKHAKGEYLLLFNNDTILQDDITPVIAYLKNNKDVGAAGIKMLNGNKDYLPSVGKFPDFESTFLLKRMFNMGEEFRTGNFTKEVYEIDWLSGSFIIMPKEVYLAIKGFDEDYFMYVEDVDFCKKIEQKGYKRVFMPQYKFVHFVGFDKSRNPLLVKGHRLFIKKHFTGVKKAGLLAVLQLNATVKQLKLKLNID